MPIPENIKKEHIIQAINKIDKEGIPAYRGERKWTVKYEGKNYPCKLVISWGNLYANGFELDPNPTNFTTNMARVYLEELRFTIIPLPVI